MARKPILKVFRTKRPPPEKKIAIKVNKTGERYTLMTRIAPAKIYSDYRALNELWGNMDKGEFYRALTRYLVMLHKDGWSITYSDTSKD